tara:strand:+ start:43 stop:453 length:411 start_codon:yes stop_codon:yes gene_type:complete
MIKKLFSKVDNKLILYATINIKNISIDRLDISPENEYIQSSISNLNKGFKIKPHKHKSFERKIYKTQEAWFLHKGELLAEFFDIDDKKIDERVLKEGDIIIIYNGGHSFQANENTILLEFKNGPYFGREIDRKDIF